MADRERILKIRDLNISFKIEGKKVNAIRGVNLDLYKGETIAIVGESGSGKSVTTKAIMGILAKNGSIESGSIDYTWHDPDTDEKHTVDITKMTEKEIQKEMNLSILFISHDLRVVYEMCDHVLIMQQGQIRESGDVEEVYFHHKDPYTGRLLKAAGILV